ncbi:MAG TPA: cell wall-active antibiotics response protein LiaF [Bacillota bacterium]|nr:cell wall-active antibiotics response protein LiaF [Bacillota bacterium]
MIKRILNDYSHALIIIGALLLVLEISFSGIGTIVSVVLSAVLTFFGWKNYSLMWGKFLFWIGIISIIFNILSLFIVRLILVAIVAIAVLYYLKSSSKKEDDLFDHPEYMSAEQSEMYSQPLLKNRFFGNDQTSDNPYSWQDINSQSGFGHREIDLSNTVLPDDTAIISIRHLFGNITIYVPYEIDVIINHNTVYGNAYILGARYEHLMNESISYSTVSDEPSKKRVKIMTTIVSGTIEVKRI